MNKRLYISKRIAGFAGRLDYYLLESKYEDIKNGISTYVYGVEIEKITKDGYNVEYIQKRKIADISPNKNKVIEFISLLAENDAMPVSLFDIAEDFICDGFFENSEKEKISA